MKLNIAYPTNGTQLVKEISTKDEQRLYGKKIGEQFDGALISEEFEGCILQIVGGNDFLGSPMVANNDTTKRIRLLLSRGDVGYRCRQKGVRRRKAVRGSIISSEIQVIALILVQVPEGKEIAGLTDTVKPKSHLPKRASKLRAMLSIPESEDIKSYITKMLKANDPEAKIPKIKITGIISEAEKKRREEKLKVRAARTAKLNEEKAAYEAKYGVKL